MKDLLHDIQKTIESYESLYFKKLSLRHKGDDTLFIAGKVAAGTQLKFLVERYIDMKTKPLAEKIHEKLAEHEDGILSYANISPKTIVDIIHNVLIGKTENTLNENKTRGFVIE